MTGHRTLTRVGPEENGAMGYARGSPGAAGARFSCGIIKALYVRFRVQDRRFKR